MKKLCITLLAALSAIYSFAYSPEVRNIDISVSLDTLGTAHIVEVWDVVVASGTEWYLVRENLGAIRIRNLAVTDETGLQYYDEGSWDVDRSISQKAGKCGLHRTSGGYEICWGVGSYGPHVFTVSYDMTNTVKSLNDYDCLHMQFVSDELSSAPGHVRLELRAPVALGEGNSRIWGFGYEGTTAWTEDGTVVAESSEPFGKYSSLILLIRFDKGIFASEVVVEKDFEAVLDRAMDGAAFDDDYEEEEEKWYEVLLGFIFFCGFMYVFFILPVKKFMQFIGIVKTKDRGRRKAIFGKRHLPSRPDWVRDLPFKGNFKETYYIASHLNGVDDKRFSIIPAMILHMMKEGLIVLKRDEKDKKEFHFKAGAALDRLSVSERALYNILKESSGEDGVLQEKEFKKWANNHSSQVLKWANDMRSEVLSDFRKDGYVDKSVTYYESLALNPDGQSAAMGALGFKQFLKEFTVINERYTPEVSLWGDYLIVAALFGMADKVARDMKHLAPDASIRSLSVPVSDLSDVVVFTDVFRAATRSAYNYATAPVYSSSGGGGGHSRGGFGGHSSFGGGGGFSGGGHGGGSR